MIIIGVCGTLTWQTGTLPPLPRKALMADKTQASTEVEAKPVKQLRGLHSMVSMLEIEASLQDGNDSAEFVAELMDKMLTAETEEELFGMAEVGTIPGKDFVARPFRLKNDGIRWMRSRADLVAQGGFPYYALMDVEEIETGQTVTLNCGAKTFVATLFRLQKLGGFDQYENGRPLMIKSKSAGNGDVLILVPVGYKARG